MNIKFWLKPKPLITDKSSLIVKSINPDEESISGILGITKERHYELGKIVQRAMEEGKGYAHTFSVLSKACVHANELAYFSFTLGAYSESQRNPLNSIFSHIFKQGHHE